MEDKILHQFFCLLVLPLSVTFTVRDITRRVKALHMATVKRRIKAVYVTVAVIITRRVIYAEVLIPLLTAKH